MFKLSICQPTYNRVYFIKDTTTKIIEQILSEHRENDVQLCFLIMALLTELKISLKK